MQQISKTFKFDYTSIQQKGNNERKETLQEVLEFFQSKAEEEFLEFMQKEKTKGSTNKRNGYRTRIIRTIYGEGEIKIPRDRLSKFVPSFIIKKFKELPHLFAEMINHLKVDHSQSKCLKFYKQLGMKISRKLTNEAWNWLAVEAQKQYINQQLPKTIDVIYLDTTFTYVKEYEGKVPYQLVDYVNGDVKEKFFASKKAVLQAYGYNFAEDKTYDLSFLIANSENVENYVELLTTIQNKGVKEIGLLVSDKHPSIRTAMSIVYPKCTKYQQCFIHAKRTFLSMLVGSHNKKIGHSYFEFLKNAYSKEICYDAINIYISQMDMSENMKNKITKKLLNDLDSLLTFKEYGNDKWRHIYTSNYIESQNKRIKQTGKLKSCSFDSTTLYKSLLISKSIYAKLI